jgi:hypothetical protein
MRDIMAEQRDDDSTARLARLEEGFVGLRGEVHSLAQAISTLNDRMSNFGRTNWGVYFAGLGVLLAFIATVGGGALAPLYLVSNLNTEMVNDESVRITRLQDKFHNHEMLDGHPTAIQRYTETTNRLDKIDGVLSERLNDLDRKLQNEIFLSDKRLEDSLNSLESKLYVKIESVEKTRDAVEDQDWKKKLIDVLNALKRQDE